MLIVVIYFPCEINPHLQHHLHFLFKMFEADYTEMRKDIYNEETLHNHYLRNSSVFFLVHMETSNVLTYYANYKMHGNKPKCPCLVFLIV